MLLRVLSCHLTMFALITAPPLLANEEPIVDTSELAKKACSQPQYPCGVLTEKNCLDLAQHAFLFCKSEIDGLVSLQVAEPIDGAEYRHLFEVSSKLNKCLSESQRSDDDQLGMRQLCIVLWLGSTVTPSSPEVRDEELERSMGKDDPE